MTTTNTTRPDNPKIGDTVTVTMHGPCAGHTGTVLAVNRSPHTDLDRYTVSGTGRAFYVDEITTTGGQR